MEWECAFSKELDGWVVEAIGAEGEVYVTQFYGPLAEARAKEYADWKNSTEQLPDQHPSRTSAASYARGQSATPPRESGHL